LTQNPESYDVWIKALREVRIFDHINDTSKLDPDKTKQVTLTFPAWAAASMDHKCPDCGWPVYIVNVGSSQYHYCTNPECYNSVIFRSISDNLQHSDRMKWERLERVRIKKVERERKAAEERKQDQVIEDRVRRILLSYNITMRRKSKT
jgi:hypothetical protein